MTSLGQHAPKVPAARAQDDSMCRDHILAAGQEHVGERWIVA
jgi:hypothetical protein